MEVCILTNCIYNPLPEYVAISDAAKARYCAKHGLGWLSLRSNPHPDSHPVWCKPSLLAWALERYEWAIWMDADALPCNMRWNVAKYLEVVEEPVVMAKDINGFNAGVFAVRRDARDWLGIIDSRRQLPQYTRRFREQQAMADSIAMGEIQCRMPGLAYGWNDYIPELYNRSCDRNVYRRGESWVLHLPAIKDCDRASIMQGEAI